MDLFPFVVSLFPNVGQARIYNFNCLLLDKEEIFILFPMWGITSVRQLDSRSDSYPSWSQAAMFLFQR